jgi:hypothetical protein
MREATTGIVCARIPDIKDEVMVTRRLLHIAMCSAAAILCSTHGIYGQQTVQIQNRQFRIPYHISQQVAAELKPREVQLFVSGDRGQTWQLSGTARPTITHFRFKAASDGEYWFDVRTVDSNNRIHPPTTDYRPTLKVIVDSTAPKIELNLTQVDALRVRLQWSVRDTGLLVNSMIFEYIEPGSVSWQPTGIVGSSAGESMWTFGRTGIAGIRCRVKDQAGNVGTTEKKVDLSIVRAQPSNETQPAIPVSGTADRSVTSTSPEQLAHNVSPASNELATINPAVPEAGAVFPDGMHTPGDSSTTPAATAVTGNSTTGDRMLDNIRSKPATGPGNAGLPRGTEMLPAPPVKNHRMVNSNTFQVSYKLDDIGRSDVCRVEFFITENDGGKWWTYGDDQDRHAPFQIQVPRDGVYGFAIRASSGAGLAGKAPTPGDTPEIVVEVDTTRPFVQLKPLEPNSAPGTRSLAIRWSMSDTNLAARPVGLYFARQKHGPWESINGWMENTGAYTWNVGPEVPTRIFLRIVARDTAGNISELETQKPVLLATARPSARIAAVQPFGEQ